MSNKDSYSQTAQNLEKYQDSKRAQTYARIDEAIVYLREAGLPVTKKSLAEEAGLHPNTLGKQHVREYLAKFKEFSPDEDTDAKLQSMQQRIVILENQLSHSRNNNAKLRAENDRLRDEKREFEDKYRRLLGRYQIDVGKMKIGF